jgi:hypothetical protein
MSTGACRPRRTSAPPTSAAPMRSTPPSPLDEDTRSSKSTRLPTSRDPGSPTSRPPPPCEARPHRSAPDLSPRATDPPLPAPPAAPPRRRHHLSLGQLPRRPASRSAAWPTLARQIKRQMRRIYRSPRQTTALPRRPTQPWPEAAAPAPNRSRRPAA